MKQCQPIRVTGVVVVVALLCAAPAAAQPSPDTPPATGQTATAEALPPAPATDAVPAHAAAPTLRWENGTTTIEGANASLGLTNRVWALFLEEIPNDMTALAAPAPGEPPPEAGKSRGSFRIRKAETSLEGWFWQRSLEYELELTYRSDEGILNKARIDWDVLGNHALRLRFGMFKAFLGREELTSSEKLQFVTRSIVSEDYAPAEQVGIMLHGRLGADALEYAIGAFNGNGRAAGFNDNNRFQWNARLMWQPLGDVGYSDGDFESRGRPLVALGVEAQHDDRRGATPEVDHLAVKLGADLAVKFCGFSLLSHVFWSRRTPESDSGAEAFDVRGFMIQAGQFVYRRQVELAARYASWDPSTLVVPDRRSEVGGAASWYVRGHALKVQADVRHLVDKATDARTYEARLQTVFWF